MPDTTETVSLKAEQFAAWASGTYDDLKKEGVFAHIVFVVGPDYRYDGNWPNPDCNTSWNTEWSPNPDKPARGPIADAIRAYVKAHPDVDEVYGDFYGLEVGGNPQDNPAFNKPDDDFVIVDCPLEEAKVQEVEG